MLGPTALRQPCQWSSLDQAPVVFKVIHAERHADYQAMCSHSGETLNQLQVKDVTRCRHFHLFSDSLCSAVMRDNRCTAARHNAGHSKAVTPFQSSMLDVILSNIMQLSSGMLMMSSKVW